jgi:hypothetical protein
MSSDFNISARMVARYAPPISYNFLNLIRLDGDERTIFEQVFPCCCVHYSQMASHTLINVIFSYIIL